MDLYFLDDGSLIIVKPTLDNVKSITLIPPDEFEVVRTIGRNYLSHLSGKEAYDFLVEQDPTLVKNGLPNHTAYDEIEPTPPPNSPRDKKYNLRSHVIDME